MQTVNDSRTVAQALGKYVKGPLADLWKRAELNPRDRSIVTVAALIARNQTIEMQYYFNLALDNGVKPREISEIITHLAFYSGWANATSAVAVAKDVFANRKIGADSFLRPQLRFFRSIRTPKRNAQRMWNNNSGRSLPELCST